MYLVAEFWAKKYDEGNTCYGVIMIGTMIGIYGSLGFLLYVGFKYYWLSGCYSNKIILLIMPLFAIVFTVLVLLRFHPKGSVITAGSISLYGAYMAWSALLSNPYTECQIDSAINNNILWIQLFSNLLVGFGCTIYWALSHTASGAYKEAAVNTIAVNNEQEVDEEEEKELLEAEEKERNDEIQRRKSNGIQGNLIDKRTKRSEYWAYEDSTYLKFHLFMALFAIYLCPVFSNWN